MENPKQLRYTKEHEWVKLEDDVVTVGITHHAQELLTDIVFVELPAEGVETEQFRPFMIVESVKSVSDVFAPVSGEIVEVNQELHDHPELVNEDAFGKGWMVKIKIKDKSEFDKLLSVDEYDKLIKEEH